MKININSQVRVKLTQRGKDEWNYHFNNDEAKENLIIPFWELMQVFGGGMHMGMQEMYFVGNEVEIIE